MAGILTAYFLKQHGVEPVVLEAKTVGSGQTRNTTAKITSQPVSYTHLDVYKRQVQHKTFGKGLVISATPMGNDVLLEIAFEQGTKKLMANFARLAKVE